MKTSISFLQDSVPEDCMVVWNQLNHQFKFCINNESRQVLLDLLFGLVNILLINIIMGQKVFLPCFEAKW